MSHQLLDLMNDPMDGTLVASVAKALRRKLRRARDKMAVRDGLAL